MAQVVLIHPSGGYYEVYRNAPGVPLNLLNLASFLKDKYSVKIIDQRLGGHLKGELASAIGEETVCVGMTCYTGPSISSAVGICGEVRKLTGAPIVWGGVHVSLLPSQSIEHPLVDAVVMGEGEVTFRKLVDSLDAGTAEADIAGVVRGNGRENDVKMPEFINMNSLPALPYDLIQIDRYLYNYIGKKTMNFQTSRGCPNGCGFCYNSCFNRNTWRAMSVERTLEHLEYPVREFGVNDVLFVDDNIFVDLDRMRKLMEALAGWELSWQCQGIDIATLKKAPDELLGLIAKSGCRRLVLGVDAGSRRIRKMFHKPYGAEEIVEQVKRLKKFDIIVHATFISGFPGETRDEVMESCGLMMALMIANRNVRTPFIYQFTPYPGTDMFDKAVSGGFAPPANLDEWSGVDSSDFTPSEYGFPMGEGVNDTFLRKISFVTHFLDAKVDDYHAPLYVRLLSKLYRPIAWFRLKHSFLSFMPEERLFRLASSIAVRRKYGVR